MEKILTVLGAHPQFIKASVVSHALRRSGQLQVVLVHTGQHFDTNMSEVFFDELGMNKPDLFQDIHGGGHGAMTCRMLERLEQVMQAERPDAVLVYGDTNSTLAGALAAAKLHIPVAHVEAGLRSFNMAMPEEVNRILTDCVSRCLFTPTRASTQHLVRDDVAPAAIEDGGRCDVRRSLAPRPACRCMWPYVAAAWPGLGGLCFGHCAPRRKHRPSRPAACYCGRLRVCGPANARCLANAPAHPGCAAKHGTVGHAVTPVAPAQARGLFGHGATLKARCGHCLRFGWGAKRGVFLPSAVCHFERRDGVGGAG